MSYSTYSKSVTSLVTAREREEKERERQRVEKKGKGDKTTQEQGYVYRVNASNNVHFVQEQRATCAKSGGHAEVGEGFRCKHNRMSVNNRPTDGYKL